MHSNVIKSLGALRVRNPKLPCELKPLFLSHNGIVAEPANPAYYRVADARGKKGTPSSARSSSVETTSKKESEVTSTIINTTSTTLPVQTIMVRPENPTTSIGQQSYYRQTTASSGAYYCTS